MNKLIFFSLLLFCFSNISKSQTTKTVGASGNYTTLKGAFDAINSGSLTGTINLQIISSIADNNSAVLNASGTGSANYSSVLIYPTGSGYVLSGSISNPTIDLNGADNVTIDGRVGAAGTSKDLVITNSKIATSACTIRFLNSAQNNKVQYCTLKGSQTGSGAGLIWFATSTAGTGNDNNIIENNNITSDTSGITINAIYSSGTSGRENSTNLISKNNIYDFLSPIYASRGLNIASNSNDWTVSENSFYQTTTLVPAGNNNYNIISVSTTVSHNITGNYIGGSAPLCTGSAFTITASTAHYFYGIYVVGGTTTHVTVQNNIIQNINFTSTNGNPWDGINIAAGAYNVDVINNTIGASTGTGSIVLNTPNASATTTITGGVVTSINLVGGGSGFTVAPLVTFSVAGSTAPAIATAIISGGSVTGFDLTNGGTGYTSAPTVNFNGTYYSTSHGIRDLSTGIVNISGNNVGSITTVGNIAYSQCFESIVISGSAPSISITNNLIGSLTTANSIHTSSTGASSLIKQDTRGIQMNAAIPTVIITGNTIANLTSSYTGTSISKLDGISTFSGSSNTIQNNTIRNLTACASSITVKGIEEFVVTAGTNQTITGNTIYNLSNTNASLSVIVKGIDYMGPTSGTNLISGNFIYGLSIASSNTASEIDGISLGNSVSTIANNIISLGTGITSGCKIYGIIDNSSGISSYTNNIYFNTIYIAGTVASGVTASTAALWNSNNTATRNYRNNILMNDRSGGSTGKHYSVRIAGIVNLTIDYNDYYVSGSGVLGYLSGIDKTTLAAWKAATTQDANSTSTDPGFVDAGDTNPADYIIAANLPGIAISGIEADYSGITRNTVPKIGALETMNFIWKGTTSTDFATGSNWIGGEVPLAGADIAFDNNPLHSCLLDGNRSIGNLTINQSTYILVLNGHQLTIDGSLNLSNGAQIDASASLSVTVFAGRTAQSIPASAFVSSIADALTINNSAGVSLNSALTIQQTLTLTSGDFSIGANTLTLNGAIATTAGTLTGGTTSNLIIGGTTVTNLPALTINNLTINRSGGINLAGSLSVLGTLALTNGTLTLGANTLTLAGNSLTRTTGNIDASNSGATLIISNTASINLPASVFYGSINNLTVNGAGGLVAGSNLTINGVLNLAVANPSATRGLLEMAISYSNYPGTLNTDYLNSYVLTMGPNATNIGIGDVTGTVKRTSLIANTPYTFGQQFTTISLTSGSLPTELSVTITIGNSPPGPSGSDIIRDAIKRTYEIVATGGSGIFVSANLHYLTSELTSSITSYVNTEQRLTTMDYDINGGMAVSDEHGRANYNYTNKYIGFSGVPISYFIQIPVTHAWRTIFSLRNFDEAYFTWNGSISSAWGNASNWTISSAGSSVPDYLSHVIIPDAATTPNDPTLPTGNTIINTLSIEQGGILNMGAETLTIQNSLSGGWEDQNPIGNDPGNSTVIFSTPNTTISGHSKFYNVNIGNGADISNQAGSSMNILNSITKTGTGKWYADVYGATVEYGGSNQTVLLPDGSPSYHNLLLSGSGTKTLPSAQMLIDGDFTLSGTSTSTAGNALTINGALVITEGAAFNTGNYNHSIGRNFDNSGTFNAASGYGITMNGSALQSLLGGSSSVFQKLSINNSNGVSLSSNITVDDTLNLIIGNLMVSDASLGINGSINKSAGFLSVLSGSSLSFGGTSAITLPNNLFFESPSLNNFSLNRSGGLTLGNQSLTVNGLLNLTSGTLHLANNSLTLAGSSPTRSSGDIDAATTDAQLRFTNINLLSLPASLFSGAVYNLMMNGVGGVSMNSDISISNNLQFAEGIMYTGANFLILNSTASEITGADANKYIDGKCRKIGNTAFTFHVGSNGKYAPISISAPSQITDAFTANYVNANPNTLYNVNSLAVGLNHVSNCEYWMVDRTNGNSNVKITLSYDESRSCGINDLSSLTVAKWDGAKWTDAFKTDNTGTTTSGTLTSNDVSSFSAFTLGSTSNLNPLPIQLISFQAECTDNVTKLSWRTASENANDYFELMKSTDAKAWHAIGTIKGAGNSNEILTYHFIDAEWEKTGYYRLKQVDFNGKNSFSNIIFSNCLSRQQGVIIFPNPASNEIHIVSYLPFTNSEYSIINQLGETVLSGTLNGNSNAVNLEILTKGIYFLILNENQNRRSYKVVVE